MSDHGSTCYTCTAHMDIIDSQCCEQQHPHGAIANFCLTRHTNVIDERRQYDANIKEKASTKAGRVSTASAHSVPCDPPPPNASYQMRAPSAANGIRSR